MKEIHMSFPQLPESVNNLYFHKGNRRILTSKGEKYKNQFKLMRGGLTGPELMSIEVDPNGAYELNLYFFCLYETLYNPGFGKDKRVKSPFKKFDTSNMIKLAEDCVADLLGIRDQNNFSVLAHKRLTPNNKEFIYAIYRPLDLSQDPHELVAA